MKYWRSSRAPSGWKFTGISHTVHNYGRSLLDRWRRRRRYRRYKKYHKCQAKKNWFGFCSGHCSGTIKTTLRKCGKAKLKFGNCYGHGYVVAKLNGRQVGRANAHQSKKIVFAFKDGDILELSDIGSSIIQFDDLNIISCSTCLGK